jgi:hypothetical protein
MSQYTGEVFLDKSDLKKALRHTTNANKRTFSFKATNIHGLGVQPLPQHARQQVPVAPRLNIITTDMMNISWQIPLHTLQAICKLVTFPYMDHEILITTLRLIGSSRIHPIDIDYIQYNEFVDRSDLCNFLTEEFFFYRDNKSLQSATAEYFQQNIASPRVAQIVLETWNTAIIKNDIPGLLTAIYPCYTDQKTKAQGADHYYANLVCGASNGITMAKIWQPHDNSEHSTMDKAEFSRIIWSNIKQDFAVQLGVNLDGQVLANKVALAKQTKQALKDIWEVSQPYLIFSCFYAFYNRMIQKRHMYLFVYITTTHYNFVLHSSNWQESNSYRISNLVHMAEIAIINRLRNQARLLLWWPLKEKNPDMKRPRTCDTLRLCLYLRRSPDVRYFLAAAVGKRLFSEHISNTHRSQILEHRRAVTWYENEFATLCLKIRDCQAQIQADAADHSGEKAYLFMDYVPTQTESYTIGQLAHLNRIRTLVQDPVPALPAAVW